MSLDLDSIRRTTKRPKASKIVHIDQDNSSYPDGSFSNNSSQTISPDNYTLSSLKSEINKFDDGRIDKNHVLQYLQYHLALLERYRSNFINIMQQAEQARFSSRPEQISKAQVIDFNPPIKIRSGYHLMDSSSNRPSVIISSNILHGSSSSGNLLSISRSHTSPLSTSVSTASISLISPRNPSSPASSRDKTRSTSVETNSFPIQSGNDGPNDKNNISLNSSANNLDSRNDDDNSFLGNQDSYFRSYSDPIGGLNSVAFSSSSASLTSPQAAAIPRSMSTSHFSRNSNSASDGQSEKESSSNNSSNNSSNSSTKSMTALTIWNNVNKFFIVTPTVEQFQQRLQVSMPPDIKLPLGPHYSIGINQKLKQKFKNGNVQIRIPPEVMAESPEGVTSIIFHRLLASFVALDEEDLAFLKRKKSQYEEDLVEECEESDQNPLRRISFQSSSDIPNEYDNSIELERPIKLSNLKSSSSLREASSFSDISFNQPKIIDTRSLSFKTDTSTSFQNLKYISDYSNIEQFPVNVAGTSVYSMCPFEQKLMLEVQSLNLIPEPSALKMTDNEVMNDIIQKTKELKQVADETNKMKTDLLNTLRNKEKELLERKEKSKKWGSVSFKVEQGQKKDLKRPKKRDKLI